MTANDRPAFIRMRTEPGWRCRWIFVGPLFIGYSESGNGFGVRTGMIYAIGITKRVTIRVEIPPR